MTRVAFPFARHYLGGSTVSGARLVSGLTHRHDVQPRVVAHSRGPAFRRLVATGLHVEVCDGGRGGTALSFANGQSRLAVLRRLAALTHIARDWLANNPTDLIHANDDMVGVAWGLAGRTLDVPLIWHIRQPQGNTLIDRVLLALSSYLIFVADGNRGRFIGQKRLPPNRTIYNGLNAADYRHGLSTEEARLRIGIGDTLPIVGFVGNLTDRKRPDRAVEVSQILHARNIEHHLVVVGADYSGGFYTDLLREMAAASRIERHLHLLGERDDVPQLMRGFDVFILTSEVEAFGLVVIEAMASGIPVVATAVDGVPEIIEHGISGYLADREDMEVMADTIAMLLTENDTAQRVGTRARTRAADVFSIDRTVDQVAEVYAELLEDVS